jgi:ADP-ribosylglycohydrolase
MPSVIPSLQSRVRGCVIGAAIGDALGHPTEFLRSFDAIHEKYGPEGVKGYELHWERDGRRFAPYTDDTQMAELVLRTFTWARQEGAVLERAMRYLAKRFVVWSLQPQGGHRAPGQACLAGCRMLASGAPWDTAGGEEAGGCGSVMRAYPAGLLFQDDLEKAEAWAVAQSLPTHRAPLALAACAALARGVALCLRDAELETVFSSMIQRAAVHDTVTAELIDQARSDARRGKAPAVVLEELQGWAAHECIAAAVYVCARHEDSLPQALLEAANTPGDSDSIATLVGALLGARLGIDALPAGWVAELERSTELLALADEACASLG